MCEIWMYGEGVPLPHTSKSIRLNKFNKISNATVSQKRCIVIYTKILTLPYVIIINLC